QLACMVLIICMFAGAPLAQAIITPEKVSASVAPCGGLLGEEHGLLLLGGRVQGDAGRLGAVLHGCCSGLSSLVVEANTTADRQQLCNCMTSSSSSVNMHSGLAAALPSACGVSVPFNISANTDCASVQ
ncbi:hypothetical protein Tsubulata_043529, partial [Turnera subulata]